MYNEPFLTNPPALESLMLLNPARKRRLYGKGFEDWEKRKAFFTPKRHVSRKKIARKIARIKKELSKVIERKQVVHKKRKIKRSVAHKLATLPIIKVGKRKKSVRRTKHMKRSKKSRKIRRHKRRGVKRMSRRKSHKLVVFGATHNGRRGYRTSRRSRLLRHSRGSFLNPANLIKGAIPSMKPLVSDLLPIIAGFVGVKFLPKYIPQQIGGIGNGIVGKLITVLGLSIISGSIIKKSDMQKALVTGGLLAIGVDLLAQYAPGVMSMSYPALTYTSPMSMIIPSNQVPNSLSGDGEMIEAGKVSEEWY